MPIKIKSAIAGAGGEGGGGHKGGDGGVGGNTSVFDGEIDEVKSGAGGKGGLSSGLLQKGGSGGGGGALQIGTKGYLLAETRLSGHTLSLSDFAKRYGISSVLKAKLEKEGYTNAEGIRWLTTDDAEEMKLKKGEIASLKGALDNWSPK